MATAQICSPHHAISGDIRALSDHLQSLVGHSTTPALRADNDQHKGARYRQDIVVCAKYVNAIERQYGPCVSNIAARITRYGGAECRDKPEVLELWHRLAQAVIFFSEHPTKKVATLIVSPDNRLEAFSANRIPPGIRKRGRYYISGERKNYIVCSERMGIANLLGLQLHRIRWRRSPDGHQDDHVRQSIADFSEAITAAIRGAQASERFLFSTTTPCDTCADTVVALRPAAVYTNSRTGHNFTRNVRFDRMKDVFAAQAIPLIDLAPGG